MKKEKINFLVKNILSVIFVMVSCSVHLSAEQERPPNVVVILADDYGYDDVGINNPLMVTPHLDKLASQSVNFDQFYVHPSCAPTRASFLTGRHFLRTGVWGVHGGRDFIRPRETLLPEVFKANGYRTGMMGKWHSGKCHGYYPWDRGFDVAHMARLYKFNAEMGARSLTKEGLIDIQGWSEEFYTDRALEFIESNKDNPFFLYIPYMSTHNFWRAPQEYIDKHLKKGSSESLAVFQGMTEYMDHQIGRVLKKLDDLQLDENTIVVFFSDNGPIGNGGPKPAPLKGKYKTGGKEWNKRNPHGLRGGKGKIFENGIRSPLFVKAPGVHKPAKIDIVTSVHDLYPTLLDLAGLSAPEHQLPLDGDSLKPLLKTAGNPGLFWKERSHVYPSPEPNGTKSGVWGKSKVIAFADVNKQGNPEIFRFENINVALRKGDFKYTQWLGETALFNIRLDPREKNPIRNMPELESRFESELREWWQDIIDDPYTHWKPTYSIGSSKQKEKISVIYTSGAYRLKGDVRMEAHGSYNWKTAGDTLFLKTKIAESGKYRVSMAYQSDKKPSYAEFAIQIGDESLRAKLTQAKTHKTEDGHFGFKPEDVVEIGIMELEKTEYTDLVIRLLKNPSKGNAVNHLRFLIFENLE